MVIPKQLSNIPEKFSNMVVQKADVKPTESDFEFTVPSPQFWNDLTAKEQSELRQIVAEEGQDLDDYLDQMRQMLPRNPRGR